MSIKSYKIKVNIFSIEDGNTNFNNVKAIKIVDKKYNILIMEDYLPVIGEIDGDISIILDDNVVSFNNIKGFYKHSKNRFDLLIKEIN